MAVKTGDKTRDKITLAPRPARGGSTEFVQLGQLSSGLGWSLLVTLLFGKICMEMGAIYYRADRKNVREGSQSGTL